MKNLLWLIASLTLSNISFAQNYAVQGTTFKAFMGTDPIFIFKFKQPTLSMEPGARYGNLMTYSGYEEKGSKTRCALTVQRVLSNAEANLPIKQIPKLNLDVSGDWGFTTFGSSEDLILYATNTASDINVENGKLYEKTRKDGEIQIVHFSTDLYSTNNAIHNPLLRKIHLSCNPVPETTSVKVQIPSSADQDAKALEKITLRLPFTMGKFSRPTK